MACGGCGARRGCSAPEVGGPRALPRARPPARLPLAARDVLARAGVDADHFTLVDEERHPHHRAGLELGGFWPPVAVSPRSPGSVSMTLSSMCGGGVTTSGSLFQSVTMQTTPSLSHCAFSPSADLPAVYCSKFSGTMKCQKSPSW